MRTSLVLIGIAFVLGGILNLAAGGSCFMSVEPCAPISISMVLGVLFFIAGAGVLFRRRWAMFLGLPLLIMVEALAIPVVLEQFRQGDQPGSFAAIGIPIFGTVAVLAAVAFIVLLRAALAARH